MGNNIGGRKKAKVMKIDGQTLKFKIPVRAGDVLKDYQGYVLLDSSAVKQLGIRAKPLEPQQELKPKKIYFLIELPKAPVEKVPRRARSSVHLSAKDRLECLMLSKRSASDLTIMRPYSDEPGPSTGPVQVKLRLPKAQVAKLVDESEDEVEVAEKIIDLYLEDAAAVDDLLPDGSLYRRQSQWKPNLGGISEGVKLH